MPFGKYQYMRLIDLPEEYLFWFSRRDFPAGELGRLMALSLELKIEGLDSLVKAVNKELPAFKIDGANLPAGKS